MRETLEKWMKNGRCVCVYFVNETVIGRYKKGWIIRFDDKEGPDKGIVFKESYSGAEMIIPYSVIQAVSEYPIP